MLSKEATKTLQNLPAEFHLLNVKSNGRFCQTFVAFIENPNFKNILMFHKSQIYENKNATLKRIWPRCGFSPPRPDPVRRPQTIAEFLIQGSVNVK